MEYLVGVESVHTAAAACDYLGTRVDEGDVVRALAVHPDDDETGRRDRQEALNVTSVRLAVPDVETEQREGDPAEEIVAAAESADELVIGARSQTPGADAEGLGETARAILEGVDLPVVVLTEV